jgi:hypothetical protein|uniref:Uncharacterized protein n=1 Tax=Desulfobacca acetoxidans TaxID=60893 RepID=A0A7V6A4S1_9BACT
MKDMDKALDALKVQIKKEIIDNYFAARCDLEEDHAALEREMADYRHDLTNLSPLFLAFYAALGQEAAIDRVMQILSLADRPYHEDFRQLPPRAREGLLKKYHRWAFTASGRRLNMVLDIYRELEARCRNLKEKYDKVETHLQLLNEDIEKFNNSFDFSLIAAQVEAMEGGGEPICGGLLCEEREELSTRMRFKHKKLTDKDLPPPPSLPPLEAVKRQIKAILQAFPS